MILKCCRCVETPSKQYIIIHKETVCLSKLLSDSWWNSIVTHKSLVKGTLKAIIIIYYYYSLGGEFLRQFACVPSDSWKCAFCLTKDGKAVKIQRTIFSECFYIMAMDELSRVTGDKDMQVKHLEPIPFCNFIYAIIFHWVIFSLLFL